MLASFDLSLFNSSVVGSGVHAGHGPIFMAVRLACVSTRCIACERFGPCS